MARWQKYESIALDEVGYVPLAEVGAEFLFQVISDRAELAAIIVTTSLPFSVWTKVFPNPLVQGVAGSHFGSGAHHRDGYRVVPFSADAGAEEEEVMRAAGARCFWLDRGL